MVSSFGTAGGQIRSSSAKTSNKGGHQPPSMSILTSTGVPQTSESRVLSHYENLISALDEDARDTEMQEFDPDEEEEEELDDGTQEKITIHA